uniref:HCO3_cotransp domain-containing protein n=1 Tax=Mesocestoides corti TaxID=53468 RepID=A0A5K3EX31_MESCO
QCSESSQKLRTASLLRGRKCDASGILQWRRIRAQTHRTTWTQPILCLSVFQWHARKVSSQPEKDTSEEQCIMSDVGSVVDSDGRRLTCSSGLWLVNKAYPVVPVFFMLVFGYSTLVSADAFD